MKTIKILIAGCLISSPFMTAQVVETIPTDAVRHYHIYTEKNPTQFRSYPREDVASFRFDPVTGKVVVSHRTSGDIELNMANISKMMIGHNIPRIDIYTTNTLVDNEIQSKTIYEEAQISIDGNSIYEDFAPMTVSIRGRGNSTWGMPKKPYRLKFAKKQSLLGFKKAKNYVLLANYMDYSLMRNYVAMQFAQMIGTDYPNHIVPVEVYLNGEYKGSYMLTEKVGINSGSIAMSDEDEANSILFELDSNAAEPDEYPFTESTFNLPCRVKDPDVPTDPTEQAQWLSFWRSDLNEMTAAIKAGADPWEYIDLDSFVKYIMAFNFCTNQELKHPKSVYLHKTKGGKYHFGPIWDFDWAFGYDEYSSVLNFAFSLFSDTWGTGSQFFLPLVKNQTFINRYKEIWQDFYDNHREEFLRKFDSYAAFLEPSSAHDKTILQRNDGYHNYIATPTELREWLVKHMEWINRPQNNYGLY